MTDGSSRNASRRRPILAKVVHAARVALVVGLLLAIPSPPAKSISDLSMAPSIDQLDLGMLDVSVDSVRINPDQDANGMWRVEDVQGNLIAFVARTLPQAEDVVGYRGPSEASILLDPELIIRSVSLLGSADTQEHVDALAKEKDFFEQFEGWPWGGPSSDTQIDAVSGATLTSLALAEGVLKRIGGQRPSLVFDVPLDADEISDWFPNASTVDEISGDVRNAAGEMLGRAIRSGPLTDDVIGYQGPTEVIMQIGPDDRLKSIRLRRSLDNEPYVDYVRVEAGFWAIFRDKTLAELAEFSPEQEGVEGVSGATMTSLAVADTIVAAAKARKENASDSESTDASWITETMGSIRWSSPDIAAIATLVFAGLLSRLGLFHVPAARRLWLLLVIAVIGLWSGNLISMALVAGWSAEGVAWRLAPGLFAIAAVALLFPPTTKSNPYCNHLCPHGAFQQLIKPASHSRRRLRLSGKTTKWLRRIPGTTLVVAYICLLIAPTIDLSSWEPFHAYLFRIAGWGSLGMALGSLAIAAVIPMGYCRLGCPTGRLLDYLRRSAVSDRIQTSDIIAIGLFFAASAVRWVEL